MSGGLDREECDPGKNPTPFDGRLRAMGYRGSSRIQPLPGRATRTPSTPAWQAARTVERSSAILPIEPGRTPWAEAQGPLVRRRGKAATHRGEGLERAEDRLTSPTTPRRTRGLTGDSGRAAAGRWPGPTPRSRPAAESSSATGQRFPKPRPRHESGSPRRSGSHGCS